MSINHFDKQHNDWEHFAEKWNFQIKNLHCEGDILGWSLDTSNCDPHSVFPMKPFWMLSIQSYLLLFGWKFTSYTEYNAWNLTMLRRNFVKLVCLCSIVKWAFKSCQMELNIKAQYFRNQSGLLGKYSHNI